MAVTSDASPVSKRFPHGLTEHNADVFDRVVRIHRGVAIAAHLDPELPVATERLQHVIEKRNTGGHSHRAAVKIDAGVNSSLEGGSGNVRLSLTGSHLGGAHAACSRVAKISSSCSAKTALSSGVPIETRRQSMMPNAGLPKWRTKTPRFASSRTTGSAFGTGSRTSRKFGAGGSGLTPGVSRRRLARISRSATMRVMVARLYSPSARA